MSFFLSDPFRSYENTLLPNECVILRTLKRIMKYMERGMEIEDQHGVCRASIWSYTIFASGYSIMFILFLETESSAGIGGPRVRSSVLTKQTKISK